MLFHYKPFLDNSSNDYWPPSQVLIRDPLILVVAWSFVTMFLGARDSCHLSLEELVQKKAGNCISRQEPNEHEGDLEAWADPSAFDPGRNGWQSMSLRTDQKSLLMEEQKMSFCWGEPSAREISMVCWWSCNCFFSYKATRYLWKLCQSFTWMQFWHLNNSVL